ncbi:unnamed protein product [Caenorhabditis angaria]|uniref:aECM cysteine-cradle domain-containing protein n=1 Tax=Caenorhabditis angaria TaxID=860376 RepID=A0A9P1IXW0_9PELO|nr:unnamed protein product [Caenorhabditis angaria]
MKYIFIGLALLFVLTDAAYKSSNGPMKTKKYKCIEVSDDEEIIVVPKKKSPASKYPWKAEEEKVSRRNEGRSAESIEMPLAKKNLKLNTQRIVPSAEVVSVTEPTVSDVQRDSKGRPLILSPEHCKQVEHYSKMYGVKDVLKWVRGNCSFAKMYVPGATCEEINILVGSCYKKN